MLLRSTLILGPSIIFPRLAAFLIVLILTHRLQAEELGLYTLVILAGEAIDMTGSNWIRFSLLRLDISNPGGWRAGLRRSYVLFMGSIIVEILASAGVSRTLAAERFWGFLFAVGAYVISNGMLRVGLTSLQMRQKNVTYSAIEVSRAILQISVVLLLILAIPYPTYFDFALATSAVSLGLSVVAIGLGRSGIGEETSNSPGYWDRLRYGSSLILLMLTTYIVTASDRFFLKAIDGAALVGLYAAAYLLGRQPIDIVSNAINQGGFPELMKRFDQGGLLAAEEFIGETFDLFALLVFSTFAALCGTAPAIAAALLPQAYRATATTLIPLIAAGGSLFAIKSLVFDNIFHMYRRNWLQLASYIPAAGVSLICAFTLVKPWGATGAAVTAVAGMAAGLGGSVIMTRKLLRVPFHFRELSKVLVIALAAGVGGFVVVHMLDKTSRFVTLSVALLACCTIWTALVFFLRPRAIDGVLKRLRRTLVLAQ
jgi:O-antigen/teichoic acid export membrane protein